MTTTIVTGCQRLREWTQNTAQEKAVAVYIVADEFFEEFQKKSREIVVEYGMAGQVDRFPRIIFYGFLCH
jgi:hypothetical protein